MKNLICIKCNNPRQIGRKLCNKCNSERVKKYLRYKWNNICLACNQEFKAWRKEQKLCLNCFKQNQEYKTKKAINNNYKFTNIPGITFHNLMARKILNRKLKTNEIVHHLDENSQNNDITNLVVLSRSIHGKLHAYLDLQRVILEKSGIENIENCWNNLRVPMTTAWLEITNAKVIKLWEIGQSAAELLKDNSQEEGSETMYDTPETDNAVGDDIVQTTTVKTGI